MPIPIRPIDTPFFQNKRLRNPHSTIRTPKKGRELASEDPKREHFVDIEA